MSITNGEYLFEVIHLVCVSGGKKCSATENFLYLLNE